MSSLLPETTPGLLELWPERTLGQPNLILGSEISLMIFEAAGINRAEFCGHIEKRVIVPWAEYSHLCGIWVKLLLLSTHSSVQITWPSEEDRITTSFSRARYFPVRSVNLSSSQRTGWRMLVIIIFTNLLSWSEMTTLKIRPPSTSCSDFNYGIYFRLQFKKNECSIILTNCSGWSLYFLMLRTTREWHHKAIIKASVKTSDEFSYYNKQLSVKVDQNIHLWSGKTFTFTFANTKIKSF